MTPLCVMSRCCDSVCGRGSRGWFNTSQFCNTLKTVIFYITRKMLKDAKKKFQLKYKYKRQNKHPSKTLYIIYGCRLNNLETKSTHTQSPYPSKIIMISAMKNSNWIADFIYTSSAQVQVGQWPIERGHTHRKPPLSKQKQNN